MGGDRVAGTDLDADPDADRGPRRASARRTTRTPSRRTDRRRRTRPTTDRLVVATRPARRPWSCRARRPRTPDGPAGRARRRSHRWPHGPRAARRRRRRPQTADVQRRGERLALDLGAFVARGDVAEDDVDAVEQLALVLGARRALLELDTVRADQVQRARQLELADELGHRPARHHRHVDAGADQRAQRVIGPVDQPRLARASA